MAMPKYSSTSHQRWDHFNMNFLCRMLVFMNTKPTFIDCVCSFKFGVKSRAIDLTLAPPASKLLSAAFASSSAIQESPLKSFEVILVARLSGSICKQHSTSEKYSPSMTPTGARSLFAGLCRITLVSLVSPKTVMWFQRVAREEM